MKTSLIAAALFALSIGAAHAGEGNGDPFPNTDAGHFVVANEVLNDTGSENTPRLGRIVASLSQGDVLPNDSSEATVQTANSMPVGAELGTVRYAQAQSMHRWMMASQARALRTANR